MQSSEIECSQPSVQTEAENAEDRILGEIFDREKVGALKTTLKLEVLIAELLLEDAFRKADGREALELARKLVAQLLTLECLKQIVAIRAGIHP